MTFENNHSLMRGFCMSHHTTKQSVFFKGPSKKVVVTKFDQGDASSDGGAVLLKACDERLKLSAALSTKMLVMSQAPAGGT